MPVSLLTPIARELHITEGLAGQGIAISGALAVLTSLTISHIAGDLNRKYLLLGLTVLMAISGLVIAMAPSYPVYMLGRALIGVVIGGFWSLSAATAIRLVPQHQVPGALAIFNGGNALATVVAAPLVGTLVVSTFLNARLYQILIMIPLLMATVAGTLLLFGHSIWAVTVLLSLWGLLVTSVPTDGGHGLHGRCPKMQRWVVVS